MENLSVEKPKISETNGHWYALRCKSNMEFVVDNQLETRNVARYLPVYSVNPVNSRSRRMRPYFPGYLFLHGHPDDFYAQRVFLMRGVIGLISFDDIPATIQPNLIEAVRRQTSRLNQEQKCEHSGFEPGDVVLIEDNTIGQIEGVFEKCINSQERVSVLLKMMHGKMMRLEVPAGRVRRKPK